MRYGASVRSEWRITFSYFKVKLQQFLSSKKKKRKKKGKKASYQNANIFKTSETHIVISQDNLLGRDWCAVAAVNTQHCAQERRNFQDKPFAGEMQSRILYSENLCLGWKEKKSSYT